MSKPILIILPGWGGTKESWHDFIALAHEKFVVHCVELPGFGAEPCPTAVWGVEEYAAFVKNKINGLGIGKKIILGHSFGGQVATYLVGNNPRICDTLILSGPAIFRRQATVKKAILKPIALLGQRLFNLPGLSNFASVARKILYKSIGSPDYNQTSGVLRLIFQKITTQSMEAYLPTISVPTLVVAGSLDTYVSSADSQKVAAAIPGATFVEFPRLRHGLHQTNPSELLKTITDFIF